MISDNSTYAANSTTKSPWPVTAFFAVYLLLGLFIFKDFGIYYDDHWGRENGVVNAKYIAGIFAPSLLEGKNYCPDCQELEVYDDADHGPIFELAPTFLEWALGIKDLQHAFQLRHLCVFLLFYLSTIFFYLILQRRFKNHWWSLAGVAMLILSPRIFAETFYNSKDLPFFAFSVISTYTLLRYLEKPGLKNGLWHAMACALAIDTRLLGLIFPALTLGFTLLEHNPFRKNKPLTKQAAVPLVLYGFMLFGFVLLFWPYLWTNPFIKIARLVIKTSRYPWPGQMLYMGQAIPATNLPWHYLPNWFFITTPVFYSILFLLGLFFMLRQTFTPRLSLYRNADEQQDWLMAGLFLIPVLAVILLNMVLYDGWRHMYFIYPAFIYIALFGLRGLYLKLGRLHNIRVQQLFQRGLIGLWVIFMAQIGFWMVKNHPHQNVYFSIYKNDSVRQQFELDYWGLAYKQGLEFVVQDSEKPEIKVFVANLPGRTNQFSLPPEQRKRLVYVDHISKAEYFLTEYRWHPADYPLQKEVHQIKVDGIKIFSVFKLDRTYPELETHRY